MHISAARAGHKSELRSNRNYLTNHTKSNHATSYLWPQGWTNIHIHICMKVKLGAHLPVVIVRLV